MSVTPDHVKRAVAAQLDRLNAFGTIASVGDALLTVRRLQERKVAEVFQSIFSDYGLEDLEIARATLAEMYPKPVAPSYQVVKELASPDTFSFKAPPATVTPPPAPAQVVPTKKKGKR